MKTIVVAGWGQVTQPKEIEYTPKDPMGLMVEASLEAGQKLASEQKSRQVQQPSPRLTLR